MDFWEKKWNKNNKNGRKKKTWWSLASALHALQNKKKKRKEKVRACVCTQTRSRTADLSRTQYLFVLKERKIIYFLM